MERKTGVCIPDEVLNIKPYTELTVGELIDSLYNFFKDRQWISDMMIGKRG